MNARLLTEQGKQRARNDWLESNPTWDDEHHLLIAQDAKSIKVDREAMAGWLEQNYGLVSMAWLVEALRTNKVPWEGKDAVHTTRKTPRTIPPD